MVSCILLAIISSVLGALILPWCLICLVKCLGFKESESQPQSTAAKIAKYSGYYTAGERTRLISRRQNIGAIGVTCCTRMAILLFFVLVNTFLCIFLSNNSFTCSFNKNGTSCFFDKNNGGTVCFFNCL